MQVVEGCPDLREISIKGTTVKSHTPVAVSLSFQRPRDSRLLTTFVQTDTSAAEHLRSLKHLTAVGLDFTVAPFYPDEMDTTECERFRVQAETDLKAWKRRVVEILNESPSKERKFLRWKVYETRRLPYSTLRGTQVVLEEGELEVLPGTSL